MYRKMAPVVLVLVILFALSTCNGCAVSPIKHEPEATTTATPQTPKKIAHGAVSRIDINERSICSATSVQPHVVLSASHCLNEKIEVIPGFPLLTITIQADIKSFSMNGEHISYSRRIDDGNDHVLIIVNSTLSSLAPVSATKFVEDDSVYYWGNPEGEFLNLYRKGYVSGFHTDEEGNFHTIYDVNGMQGDSGAGIFNSKGEISGVISYLWHFDPDFALMSSVPMNFTVEQLKDAGIPLTPENIAFYTSKVSE